MSADFSGVISATAQWLTRAYPVTGGAMDDALAQAQAHQAATVAAWLRYPTETDAALVAMVGPSGSARLDWLTGSDTAPLDEAEHAWRSWVDEVVASWAACLLTAPGLATAAVAAVNGCHHAAALPLDFRRLVAPNDRDLRAASLLRHPDLVAPIAQLHHDALIDCLEADPVGSD